MANDNVNIYLKTTINQAGESEVFEFDTTGEVLIKNGEFFYVILKSLLVKIKQKYCLR